MVTVTITLAVSQLSGVAPFSQIVYVAVYIPEGVFGNTVTVPSGFNTTPPVVAGWKGVLTERVTSVDTTGRPFRVSLSSTFNTFTTPASPSIGFVVSFTASIVLGSVTSSTIMMISAESQLVGLATSQIV